MSLKKHNHFGGGVYVAGADEVSVTLTKFTSNGATGVGHIRYGGWAYGRWCVIADGQ